MTQALYNPTHYLTDYQNKYINKNLSNISNRLRRANKLSVSLNMKKTELVIFRPRKLKIDHSFKFKLDGKRLVPTHSVKYLGVLIDEHLLWNKQVAQIKMRLNRAIGMLSKLRRNANFYILKTAYHSLFEWHLQYGIYMIMGPKK